jgi:hypothetical protein
MRIRLVAVLSSVLVGMAGALVAAGPAGASTSLKGWMLSQGDYNEFSSSYKSAIPVQWVTCTRTDYFSTPKKCPKVPGQTVLLIRETSYFTLYDDVVVNKIIKSGESVLADYETWSQTPKKQQRDPDKYICMTDQLAAKHHLFLIQSPFNPSISTRISEEVTAARCAAKYHASEVTELQYQGREVDPADYEAKISTAVKAIRRIAKDARIIGGLATDLKAKSGKFQSVKICEIVESYFATKTMLIGYWLNSSRAADAREGVLFFEDIHALMPYKNPHCT